MNQTIISKLQHVFSSKLPINLIWTIPTKVGLALKLWIREYINYKRMYYRASPEKENVLHIAIDEMANTKSQKETHGVQN